MPTFRPSQPTRPILFLAFGSIVAVLLLTQIMGYLRSRELYRSVDLVADNALSSIRLVQRMEIDIERQRILVDRHIIEQEVGSRAQTEKQIAAAKADYAATASEYAPLATLGGEARAWLRLQADVASVEAPTAGVLELSRRNLDTEARQALSALEPRFTTMERDVDELIEINQREAIEVLARMKAMQRDETGVRLALALLAASITVVLGFSVTRRVIRAEQQLEQHAAELEFRNRELDAFAGRVAHDLRGPLSTIGLAASRLFERVPQEEGAVAVFRRGMQRMEGLIEDLLTLSRIDAEAPGAVCRAESVAPTLEADLGPRVREVDGLLRVQMDPARVRCSEGLLRQVVWNLGENAVKYRRPDVRLSIEMTGRATSQAYELRVTDNGPGMSPEEVRRAFEPFFRGEQARSVPGTGLGLAIVKRIVEASGGTISVDSQPGRGTTFVVTLRLDGAMS